LPPKEKHILVGPDYELEVIGLEDRIKIYPKKLNHEPAKVSEFNIEVLYHYRTRPKNIKPGRRVNPTAKTNVSIPLIEKKDYFLGKFINDGMKEYGLVVNVLHSGHNETYRILFVTR
jgi:hypothetical protein